MSIEIVRIDDRLIHGQIVQGWLKTIHITAILVVSDEVAGDQMQQVLLSMAVPSSVKLSIKNIKDASCELANDVYEEEKLMILFSNPQDVVRMIESGIKFNSINVGGMHFAHGKKQLLSNLSVDANDVKSFLTLISEGIELESRALPQDDRYNVTEDINTEAKNLNIIR
ncbi:MAG: PTS sugar transporter subunit IIB [Endomicrobiaceae bacterium]|nr:PTS sugar transporter subunit IIB [Endomicrobiaceae bacterium]